MQSPMRGETNRSSGGRSSKLESTYLSVRISEPSDGETSSRLIGKLDLFEVAFRKIGGSVQVYTLIFGCDFMSVFYELYLHIEELTLSDGYRQNNVIRFMQR
jgi:hypothetical protein